MLLGVFGDIHSNIEALTSVYDKLIGLGCQRIVCLGDIVGYGASPGECIDFLKDLLLFLLLDHLNHKH